MRAAAAVAVAALLALPGAASAATIEVTTTDDELTADGDCSLREAVRSANENVSADACAKGQKGPNRDTIELRSREYALTLASTNEDENVNGDLDYTGGGPLTIRGKGIAATEIDANAISDRVLHASDNARSLTVESLDLENGTAPAPVSGDALGGNLLVAAGALTLSRVSVEHGTADVGGGVRFTAVVPARSITISRSRFENNEANEGGALWTLVREKPTTIRRTVFALNSAQGDEADGGALFAAGNAVTVSDSLFSENTAIAASGESASGGAIFFRGEGESGYRVERSTFQKNVASFAGSGNSFGGAVSASGEAEVVNSTFWDNESEGRGGGFYGEGTIAHSTFLANVAADDGDHLASGTGFLSGPIVVRNSILPGAQIAVDVCADAGSITSKGFNVFSYDDTGCGTLDSDVVNGGNAGLDPSVFDNGGLTPTIAISEDSVAKDLVPVSKCKIADGEDQRGRERPHGPRCDAGSFEKGGGGG